MNAASRPGRGASTTNKDPRSTLRGREKTAHLARFLAFLAEMIIVVVLRCEAHTQPGSHSRIPANSLSIPHRP